MRCVLVLLLLASVARAETPTAAFVFPAGGRRGTVVKVHVGGLNLFERAGWEIGGKGLALSRELLRAPTRWFEGPMLPLPASQRKEDYPQEMAGEVRIAADAPLGARRLRLWTSEGAASGPSFVVGDLPEVLEQEIDGDPVPVRVALPVTINGRIFPREDVDDWTFAARKGQTVTAEVRAARIGSRLDSRLELFAPDGKRLAENDDGHGTDSQLRFTAPADGVYRLRISDSLRGGSQAHVYRLTVTAGPHIDHVFPAGGKTGTRVKFLLTGANLPATRKEAIVGSALDGFPLDADTLAEYREGGAFAVPGIANGRILAPGQVDAWRFTAKKGETLEIEARPIGSPLLPRIVIERDGKPIMNQSQARFLFTPSADGEYALKVRDRFPTRGGPAFIYRLRIARAIPDFRLAFQSDAASLLRKGTAKVKILIERHGGFKEPVALKVAGLPRGVTADPAKIAPGQASVDLILKADKDSPLGPARLTMTGSAKDIVRKADGDLLVGVGLKAPFTFKGEYDLRLAPRGSVFRKRYKIDRGGFTGPLKARLADGQSRHLQGVTGPVVRIAPDADSFDFPVSLPPWMEIGRTSRSCVVLVGKVEEGGREHSVSWSSQAQNEQLIAVVETGRLGLELERGDIAAGKPAPLRFRVRRGKDIAGPVTVSLSVPGHIKGVKCAPVVLKADESAGTLRIILAPDAGPFTMPLTVRAVLGETTAEAPLSVAE